MHPASPSGLWGHWSLHAPALRRCPWFHPPQAIHPDSGLQCRWFTKRKWIHLRSGGGIAVLVLDLSACALRRVFGHTVSKYDARNRKVYSLVSTMSSTRVARRTSGSLKLLKPEAFSLPDPYVLALLFCTVLLLGNPSLHKPDIFPRLRCGQSREPAQA